MLPGDKRFSIPIEVCLNYMANPTTGVSSLWDARVSEVGAVRIVGDQWCMLGVGGDREGVKIIHLARRTLDISRGRIVTQRRMIYETHTRCQVKKKKRERNVKIAPGQNPDRMHID